MKPGSSLLHSQDPTTCLSPEPDQSSPCVHPGSWRTILILSSHLRLGLPICLIPSGFLAKTLFAPFSHTCYTPCPSPSTWFDLPNNAWWGAQITKLLCTIRYVKLYLASAFSKFSVFSSPETCTSESLLEAIRRKPAARYKDQPLPYSGLPRFPCFKLALFNVVIQERKWRKEGPSQTSINKQFDLTLSQLAVLALASRIKTPTARNAVWNEEAKTVRDSWSKVKLRCHV